MKSEKEDEERIREVESAYDRAWGCSDVEALVACFTADAVLVNPRGEVARGTGEIGEALGSFLRGPAKDSIHESQIIQIHFATADVAIVDGEASISGDSGSPITHRFTDILVRKEGTWRIAHVRAYFLEETAETKTRAAQQTDPLD
jgi:uncharacterized protein (TIGR02246 family)